MSSKSRMSFMILYDAEVEDEEEAESCTESNIVFPA